jgi:predicted membrane-bound spermidine synthase
MATRAAVFLITLSGLIFEIGLTRIYSATIWYHFTFVAVSVALLGWGLGGLVVHLARGRFEPSLETAARLALLYGLAIPACLWVLARFPFQPDLLPLYFIAPLAPFLLAGMALSTIFDLGRERAGTLYFADLVGASAGAVAVTLLLQLVGGEGTLLLAAVAPLVAAALLSSRVRLIAVVLGAAAGAGAFSNTVADLFHVIPGTTKAMRRQMDAHPGSRVAQSGWNAYSRIDGVEGLDPALLARLYIDSDAWTSVSPWDGRIENAGNLAGSFRALPFRFTSRAETLVIGPGGGTDVLAALASGSRHVTAVELNPLMIQFVRHYGAAAGNIYDRPDVEVIQSEGRNFISRTPRTFDVIFLGFVDSWASVASGGLSLSENYLYTTEAFRAYYDHLTPDGTLVILRWDLDVPRLVSNAVALLGADAASKQVVVLMERRVATPDNPPQMLFMLRRRPFTTAETDEIAVNWTTADPLILAGHRVAAPYDALLSGRLTMADYEAASSKLVGPVFDDRPFYFATERPFGVAPGIAWRLIGWLVLPSLALLALFAAFGKPRGHQAGPYVASLVYFASLGFGFIAVELALLQNLTLLVGHPIFTLSVLLFTLLAAGGAGSAVSRFVRARIACLIVAVLGGLEAWLLPTLVPALLPWPLWARLAAAAVVIAPLGFIMGMPFPIGLRRTGQGPRPAPPFYWGLNGVMSVMGSVTTVFVAMSAGFQAAMLVGCGAYLIAAVVADRAINE